MSTMSTRVATRRDESGRAGFTLLEVLVALVVLGTAVVIVLQLFSSGLRSIRASEELAVASLKAEEKMSEILDDNALEPKAWTENTDDGYRVDVSVAEALADRTENLTVRVLEVDLTLCWMAGARERSLTVRTLKVVDRLASTLKPVSK
jgi:prepilin-type N-terminal cleavage/methylation domain-containing protein